MRRGSQSTNCWQKFTLSLREVLVLRYSWSISYHQTLDFSIHFLWRPQISSTIVHSLMSSINIFNLRNYSAEYPLITYPRFSNTLKLLFFSLTLQLKFIWTVLCAPVQGLENVRGVCSEQLQLGLPLVVFIPHTQHVIFSDRSDSPYHSSAVRERENFIRRFLSLYSDSPHKEGTVLHKSERKSVISSRLILGGCLLYLSNGQRIDYSSYTMLVLQRLSFASDEVTFFIDVINWLIFRIGDSRSSQSHPQYIGGAWYGGGLFSAYQSDWN